MPNHDWDNAEHKHEWDVAKQFFDSNSLQGKVKRDITIPYGPDNKLLAHTYVKASNDIIYRLGNIIGDGSYGKVIEAWDEDGNLYAMKVSGASNRQENKTATDLGLLASPEFGCKASEEAQESYQAEDGTEFYAPLYHLGESLKAYLAKNSSLTIAQRCDLTAKIFIATYQFLRGEASCSGKEYTHDDIKPENIVIDINGNVRFIDVGLVSTERSADRSTEQGSPAHMAPRSIPGISREQASRLASMRCALMAHDFPGVDGKDLGRELANASFVFQDKGSAAALSEELTTFVDQQISPLLGTTCRMADGDLMSAEQFQTTFPKSDLDLATQVMLLKPNSYPRLNNLIFDENWSELQKQSIVNLNLANHTEEAAWQKILGDDLSLQMAIAALGKFGQEYLTSHNMLLIAESESPILQMVEIILPKGLSHQDCLNYCDDMLHNKKLSLIKRAILLLSYLGISNIQTWQKVVGNNTTLQQSLVMLGEFDPDLINEETIIQLSSSETPIDQSIEILKKAINTPTALGGKPYRELLNHPDTSPLRKAIIVLASKNFHPHACPWGPIFEGNAQLHYAIAALNDLTDSEIEKTTRQLIGDPVAQDIIYELAKCHHREINLKVVKALVAENSWLKRSFLLLSTFDAVFCVRDNILLLCSGKYSAIAARTLLEFATVDHGYYRNLHTLNRPPVFAEMVWRLDISDNDIWSVILDLADILNTIPDDEDNKMRRIARKKFIRLGLDREIANKRTSPGKAISYSQYYAEQVHQKLFNDDDNDDAKIEFMQAVAVMSHKKTVFALINGNKYFTAVAQLLGIEDIAEFAQEIEDQQFKTLNDSISIPAKLQVRTYKHLKQEAVRSKLFESQDGFVKAVKARFSFGSPSSKASGASPTYSSASPTASPRGSSGSGTG